MAKENGFTKILLIGLIVVALALALFPEGLTKFTTNDKTITVSGDAQKEVAPDQAKVYLRVYTLDEDARVSQSENTKTSNDVINALKNAGVKEADIETSSYYLQQKYDYDPQTGKSTLVGYETIQILQVTTRDVAGVGGLVDTAVGAGANGVDSVQFELRKETQDNIRKELLGNASIEAKSKADTIAGSLGVKVTGVKAVSESSFIITPYVAKGLEGVAADSTRILPQNIDVTAHVTVVYGIR